LLYFALDITLKCALYRAGLTKVKFISLDFRQCTLQCLNKIQVQELKSICPTCKQAINIFMQIRAAAPHVHPIESFVIFLFKCVLLGQKYIWPEPDHQDLHCTLDQWEETVRTGTAERQQRL
jgi:hypothetical protein